MLAERRWCFLLTTTSLPHLPLFLRHLQTVLGCTGDLHCLFCVSRVDKIDSTISIRGGKLSWATTTRLLKGIIVLIPKPSDGWRVIIDNRGNRPSKMIEINERERILNWFAYICVVSNQNHMITVPLDSLDQGLHFIHQSHFFICSNWWAIFKNIEQFQKPQNWCNVLMILDGL